MTFLRVLRMVVVVIFVFERLVDIFAATALQVYFGDRTVVYQHQAILQRGVRDYFRVNAKRFIRGCFVNAVLAVIRSMLLVTTSRCAGFVINRPDGGLSERAETRYWRVHTNGGESLNPLVSLKRWRLLSDFLRALALFLFVFLGGLFLLLALRRKVFLKLCAEPQHSALQHHCLNLGVSEALVRYRAANFFEKFICRRGTEVHVQHVNDARILREWIRHALGSRAVAAFDVVGGQHRHHAVEAGLDIGRDEQLLFFCESLKLGSGADFVERQSLFGFTHVLAPVQK